MFKNLKGIKFEKINMKLVIAIGIVVILILTAVFIIFRTNLIIDRSNDKKDPDSSQSGNDNSKPGNSDNEGEKPENPDDDKDEPNYDDPKEENNNSTGVSEEAKKREKPAEKLNQAEIEYLMQENNEMLVDEETLKECTEKRFCYMEAEHLTTYSEKYEIGYVIGTCTGNLYFQYNENTKKVEYDFSEIKCNKYVR